MRPIHLARMDKVRPVLVLTRELVRPHLDSVTVAPITSRIWGLATEVAVGPGNGLDQASVVTCDNVTTIARRDLLEQVGALLPHQEIELAHALQHAFEVWSASPRRRPSAVVAVLAAQGPLECAVAALGSSRAQRRRRLLVAR